MIEVVKENKTIGFANTERETMQLVHGAGKSIFRLGDEENRSNSLRLRGTWNELRAIGAFIADETDESGNAKTFVHFEMRVKTENGKFRGEYACIVECEVTDLH